jgi:hypothetical protein
VFNEKIICGTVLAWHAEVRPMGDELRKWVMGLPLDKNPDLCARCHSIFQKKYPQATK